MFNFSSDQDLGNLLNNIQTLADSASNFQAIADHQANELLRYQAREPSGTSILTTAALAPIITAPTNALHTVVIKGFSIYRFGGGTASLTAVFLSTNGDFIREMPLPSEADGEVVNLHREDWIYLAPGEGLNCVISDAIETHIQPFYYIEDENGLPT